MLLRPQFKYPYFEKYSPAQEEAGRSESGPGYVGWARLQPSIMSVLPGVPADIICVFSPAIAAKRHVPRETPHKRQQM